MVPQSESFGCGFLKRLLIYTPLLSFHYDCIYYIIQLHSLQDFRLVNILQHCNYKSNLLIEDFKTILADQQSLKILVDNSQHLH